MAKRCGGEAVAIRAWFEAGAVALWLCSAASLAAPIDEHQRGLLAFQRGDVAGAMAALRAPAQAGHAPSQSLLGFILDRADFAADAAAMWRQAAAQGDAEAHAGLANLYLTGRGLAKDEKLALHHFSEAALRGHAQAAEIVATAWLQAQWGADAQAQPATARAALLRAAEQGHLASADALGRAYAEGRYGLAPDAAQASSWQQRAAAWRRERAAAPVKPAP
jgi:TPR repeat protein